MITIDAPISFLIGASLAVSRRDPESHEVRGRDRLLHKGLLFQSTVLSPIILFFMSRFPDWEWNYLFDARSFFFEHTRSPLGFAVLAGVIAMVNASFYFGFRAAEMLVAKGAITAARRMIGACVLLVVAILAVLYDQSLHVGTFAEYGAGTATLIFHNPEFLTINAIAGPLIAASLWWIIRTEKDAVELAR